MSRFLRLWFYFLICLIAYSCSFMPDELKTAERLMETAPDSALHILQHMSPDKYKSAPDRALHGLLLIRALDKNMLPLQPDSLLDFAISYYENNADKDRLATCYLYKGRTYKYALQHEKAISYYLKALDILQDKNNPMLLARINFDMGDIYNLQKDYELARQKYKKSYTYFSEIKFQPQAFFSLLNIGRTYHAAHNFKIAQNYYRKIYCYAKDSLQKGALMQEIGLNFYDSHKPDSALHYYRQIINYPYIGYNRSITYSYMANLYFDINQIDSAYYYASNSFNFKSDFRTQRECYRIMTNCEFARGHINNVTNYMNKYVQLGDSMRKIETQTKGSYIESKHYTELKYVKTRKVLWYSIALIILIIACSYILYTRLYQRSKKEKIRLHETHVQQKAGIRKDIVIKYSETLRQKVEKLKTMQANERKKASYTEKVILDKKIYNELLHLDKPDLFFNEMDPVLNNLATRLKNRYPSLTVKEISWCCLSLLEVPTTDIYLLFDYTVEGLKTMRKRLAQKTGLSGVSELKDFLEKLLTE